MDINVTTFINPFSFYCVAKRENHETINLGDNITKIRYDTPKFDISDKYHGQYVAVMWRNKWARGVISIENQLLIWLIDYGIFLRPNSNTVCVDLPIEYRKYPSKIFEASVHGVTPVDKILTQDCQIKNAITTIWYKGATERAQELLKKAKRTHFVPFALLSTVENDVVLGDLYLEISDNHFINFVDELELWPVFLEKNKQAYINNLSIFYKNRRKHRACLLKPDFVDSNLPVISLKTSLIEYNAIYTERQVLFMEQSSSACSEDGSTVLDIQFNSIPEKPVYKLTHEEIKKYANMYIELCGRKYNVLNILMNKIHDLNMCERYKDHDLKSVGCGILRRSNN